jgi:hypothetical protein
MVTDPDLWLTRRSDPHATITPSGRWQWHGVITDGALEIGSFLSIGTRTRADRIARRRLHRYQRAEQRRTDQSHEVRP